MKHPVWMKLTIIFVLKKQNVLNSRRPLEILRYTSLRRDFDEMTDRITQVSNLE